MKLGKFSVDGTGNLSGTIYGLGLQPTTIALKPEVSKKNEQYFKLIADPSGEAYEIGSAHPKVTKDNKSYLSLHLDSPTFPATVHAALFADKGTGFYNLVWDRPEPSNGPRAEVKPFTFLTPQQLMQQGAEEAKPSETPASAPKTETPKVDAKAADNKGKKNPFFKPLSP
jgi:uncharacterized protein (DUF736 family)